MVRLRLAHITIHHSRFTIHHITLHPSPFTIPHSRSTIPLCSRMGVFVCILEMLARHMGVYLGGCEVGVAQQLLDGVDVGSVVEHMGGETVTEHMGTYLVGMRELRHIFLHHLRHVILVECSAIFSYKKRPLN